jgi:hypothetical protein
MNDESPPEVPPPVPPQPEPSTMRYETAARGKTDGCLFAATIAGGFAAFFVGGLAALGAGVGRNPSIGFVYMAVVAVGAVALAFKAAWRGFAIGLLLGLGAFLLLIAICGGFGR